MAIEDLKYGYHYWRTEFLIYFILVKLKELHMASDYCIEQYRYRWFYTTVAVE